MKLFHGTNIDFDNIDLKMSKPNKDFGQGFYLSDTRQQAEELAMARVELTGGNPVVIEYDFDEELLHDKSLKVKLFEEYTEDWANFILANRNSINGNIHDYDIVFGPIANDRVGRQLWRYRNHDIDMSTLVKNLKFMKGITFQYFFGTERAIKHLKKR
ncbi:DUF3990 domain-containing protein [Prevotella histicola]|jgi:hypothetical protein|uniref:DUF3990 domain-containing protein n=1 Tax=Prevotella histicola TaxID=470565 RepID=UPI001C5CED5F|nr:DUF3990 domain-containing protein [Prevotella histicola]MBW4774994.1 DUF3990 domain-containing protein [Prevotella histicola]